MDQWGGERDSETMSRTMGGWWADCERDGEQGCERDSWAVRRTMGGMVIRRWADGERDGEQGCERVGEWDSGTDCAPV